MVCSSTRKTVSVNINQRVKDLRSRLIADMTLKNPALQGTKGFLIGAGVFAEQVAHKLEMTIGQLLEQQELIDGETLTLTDSSIPSSIEI